MQLSKKSLRVRQQLSKPSTILITQENTNLIQSYLAGGVSSTRINLLMPQFVYRRSGKFGIKKFI